MTMLLDITISVFFFFVLVDLFTHKAMSLRVNSMFILTFSSNS